MKAIQTFWNITGNPYKAVGNFLTAEYGLQVWALSVHYLRKWYGEVELVTDNSAIPFLEKLNLPYTKVSTELDKLKGKVLPPTFGMAKIYACSLQDEPFTSVDLDVVLFEDVLKNHIEIPLLCQSLETDRRQYPAQKSVYYKPILDLMKRYSAKLPIYMKKPCEKYPCMSIYQCNDLEFNEKYCFEAFKFYTENRMLFMKLEKGVFRSRKVKNSGKLQKNQKCISVIPEQYLAGQLADCESKKWHGLYEDIYGGNLTALENSGFVHFWGEKLRKDTAEKVDKICWEVIPDMYLKIKNLTNEKK